MNFTYAIGRKELYHRVIYPINMVCGIPTAFAPIAILLQYILKIADTPFFEVWNRLRNNGDMNNYWTTNFRAFQEGEFRWSYYLTSSDDTSIAKATKFGWDSRIPLYARVMPVGKENNMPTEYSAFEFDKDNFLMTSSTPSREKGYVLLNVRELDGKDSVLKILDKNGKPITFSIVNVIEDIMETGLNESRFTPFENKFIKLKL